MEFVLVGVTVAGASSLAVDIRFARVESTLASASGVGGASSVGIDARFTRVENLVTIADAVVDIQCVVKVV
jgi:hypothetical protein